MASRKCGQMFRPTAQRPDIGWLQHWAVSSNRPCDVCSSGESADCPSACTAQSPFVATDRHSLVRMTNKQGKIAVFIALKVDDSLWRRNDSLWRFRPRKSRPGSLYLCSQATGRTMRLHAAVEIGSPAIRPRTDFYVRRNIARCPLSYSKGFRLLPETTLPLAGEGFPSEVGKPVSYLRYACRKLRLCRETNH